MKGAQTVTHTHAHTHNSALTVGAVTQSFLVLVKSARVLNLVEFSAGRIGAGVQTCSGDGPKPDKGS